MTKSAIVVGAGLAGLTAAYRLQQAGWRVKVLEASGRVCGRVATERHGHYLLDEGPTAISTSYTRYLQLLRELGLESAITEGSQQTGFVRKGRLHVIDGARPLRSFLQSGLLSWTEKLQIAIGMTRLARKAGSVKLAFGADFGALDVETIQQCLRGYFSETLIEEVFDPLVHCFTYGDKREASCIELFCGLDSASGALRSVRGGLETLPRALAAKLDITLNAEVTQVERQNSGVRLRYRENETEQNESADACVLTCTFQQAAALYPPLAAEGPELLAQTAIAPSFAVYLGFARRTTQSLAAIALPEGEFPLQIAVFLDHVKADDRAPPGHSLITVYYASSRVEELKSWSQAQLLDGARETVLRFSPELRGTEDFAHLRFFPRASHLAPVGHFKAAAAFLQRHRADDPVQLAGDYFSVPSQETAVAWGWRTAERMIQAAAAPI